MATRPRLNLGTKQRLALTPELRQGLALLSMPASDLQSMLQAEARENPLLILDAPSAPPRQTQTRSAFDIAAETVAEETDLGTNLRRQIALLGLSAEIDRAAQALTWSLDERGFLDGPLEDVADTIDVDAQTMERALATLQSCEPPGVGARDLRDSLRLQLVRRGIAPEIAAAAVVGLEPIAAKNWSSASSTTGLDRDTLRRIAALLPDLNAAPAARFHPAARPIVPDLVLEFDSDGTPQLTLASGASLVLRLDPMMESALRDNGAENEAFAALKTRATTLIRAFSFRNKTLLQVAGVIVAQQRAFLDPSQKGDMRPLTRQAIADTLAIHPSTVGRAIAAKVMQTPKGVLPLSSFFPAALGSDGLSAFTVQRRLAQLIAAEQPGAVLSDEKLTQTLRAEGVDIARRTVAKYRGCLGIAPSHLRKRSFARTRGDGPKGRGSAMETIG